MKQLAVLVLLLASTVAQLEIPSEGDPCQASQHLKLDQPGRSINIPARRREDVIDDSSLPSFWYRFTSHVGGKMPEQCPPRGMCSTMNTAWMDGEHPADDNEIHPKKICVNNNVDCKSECFFILVKNCGAFFVYQLRSLQIRSAYCAGTGTPCPEGETSPTGYTPCAAPEDIPEEPRVPTVTLEEHETNFSLSCAFESPTTDALHEVRWIAGGNVFSTSELAAEERSASVSEFELFYRGTTILGSSVTCEVRAWKEGIAVGTRWVPSAQPGLFLGIKVVDIRGNEVREVEIDEDSKNPKLVFLKSTVPIRCNSAKWEEDQFFPWIDENSCEINARVVNKDLEDFARQLHGECPPDVQQPLTTIAEQLEFESCAVKLKPASWKDHRLNSVTIRAVKDKIFDGRQSRFISFVVDVDYQDVWKGYEFPYLKVTALDTRQPNVGTSTCTSYNDPHLKTFDGTVYHNYNEGEYVLYENLEFNFRVHAYYLKCNVRGNLHASCNCGVAAQAGNDVIILDRCRKFGDIIFHGGANMGDKTYLRQRIIQRGDMTEGFTLEHVSGTKIYKIKFPHGAILTLTLTDSYNKQFVNLEMAPSQLDFSEAGTTSKTQGLCGVFSRDRIDDLRMPDGSTYNLSDNDKKNIYKQHIPDRFNLAWRVEPGSEKSMYNGKISDTRDYDGHRFCACVNVKEKEEVLCAFDEECRKIQDITGIVRTRTVARRKRSADPDAEYSDDDYFSDFDDSSWSFDFNPTTYLSEVRPLLEVAPTQSPGTHRSIAAFARGTSSMQGGTGTVRFRTRTVNKVLMRENSPWPTPSGWTEQTATDYCNNFVRNSDAVKVCKDIPDVNYQDDIDMCVSDIALSDTTDFAISAVQSINTKCQEKVVADMRLWTANLDPKTNSSMLSRVAPPSVMTMMCPNDCSLNGKCVEGKCECNEGYMGADCSGAANEPPSILILPGSGLCNYKRRPCRATPVLGDNFIHSPTLKCRFETAQLAEGGPVGTGEMVETTPEFESYMEIHCPLPPAHINERGENTPPRYYLVSITNDGDVMSNTKPLVVFNGRRYDCTSVNAACTAPQA